MTALSLWSSAKRSLKRQVATNRLIRTITGVLIRAIAAVRHDVVVSFYSRCNHSDRGFLAAYAARVAYDAVIDPEIRRNPASAQKYANLLFRDAAATGWSKPLEANFEYYLKDGQSSCLTPLLALVNVGEKRDWTLLELGCGTGNCIDILLQRASDRICRVDGIDFSGSAIERARSRFDPRRHEFFISDLLRWAQLQPSYASWKYDIAFSHLVLQLFAEEYVVELARLLRQKRICERLFVSDSYCNSDVDLAVVKSSIYNPDRHGYLRFDHNHQALFAKAGYPHSEVLADYRRQTGFVFVSANCV